MLVLALGFLKDYSDEHNDKDIRELLITLRNYAKPYLTSEAVIVKETEKEYKKLNELTGGVDVEVNLLGMGIGVAMLMLEDGKFKGSEALKVKRLVNSIYNKLELSQGTLALSVTNNLVKDFHLIS